MLVQSQRSGCMRELSTNTEGIQKMIEQQEEKQRQREQAVAERGQRIQALMDRMADVVVNKDKEL